MSGWFNSLGYWDQDEAYLVFDTYRQNPAERENFEWAVETALPIIRVVYSTQKFKVTYAGDEDDLVAHAALTITKALPKMAAKPKKTLDNDKKYMRYLFSCVINAFYRENDILHKKQNKLQRKIVETAERPSQLSTTENFRQLEAEMALKRLPEELYTVAEDLMRFNGNDRQICVYILQQLIGGREVAKSVLQLMGCKDRNFFIGYCQSLLFQSFIFLREHRKKEEFYEQEFIDEDPFDNAWDAVYD